MKIAVLDDYLRLSQTVADWSPLKDTYEITVFDRPLAVHDDRERARAARQRRAHLGEPARRQRLGDGEARQAAEADAGTDDALDRLAAAELEVDPHRPDSPCEPAVGRLSRAMLRVAPIELS